MPPGPRAGFSMCVHKKRAMLFGGVVDMEMEGKFLSLCMCLQVSYYLNWHSYLFIKLSLVYLLP